MSGDHNQYQKGKSYLDFECPRCGHCCQGYELGFVDGMQHQMKSSVDKALNEKREWVGLTYEERHSIREWRGIQKELGPVWAPMLLYLYEAIEAKLKEKNNG